MQDVGDGCPGLDLRNFSNDAASCPVVWREECKDTKGSDKDVAACECGTPWVGGKAEKDCYQCTGQPNNLTRKPANVTAWRANDMCGRYPPVTRRQVDVPRGCYLRNNLVVDPGVSMPMSSFA